MKREQSEECVPIGSRCALLEWESYYIVNPNINMFPSVSMLTEGTLTTTQLDERLLTITKAHSQKVGHSGFNYFSIILVLATLNKYDIV